MRECDILADFQLIKTALIRNGFAQPRNIGPYRWRLKTKGWRYTLAHTDFGWSLEPENTSQVYQRLVAIIRSALEVLR